jgi:hypothetical protein
MPPLSGAPLKISLTVDVEYAGMAHVNGPTAGSIPDTSMECVVDGKPMGLSHVVAVFGKYGLKGTFFVEPFARYRFGEAALARTVETLLAADQDVQLHLHPTWLVFRDGKIHSDRLFDFNVDRQAEMIGQGKEMLEALGARIVAFRAGGFAADEGQYAALKAAGIPLSSSYCLGYRDQGCAIAAFGDRNDAFPTPEGIWEIPASSYRIRDLRKRLGFACKPFQVGSTSAANARRVVERALAEGMGRLTVLLHNYECLDRRDPDWAWKPLRANAAIVRALDGTCAFLADAKGRWRMQTFADAARELAAFGGAEANTGGAPRVPSLNRIYFPM